MGKHHNLSQTRLYKTFTNMRQRCYNSKCPDYCFYGGKGITICDEWLNDFTSFYKWSMEHGYADELTIDRINPDKGYSPDNCQWITFSENRERAGTGRPKAENPKVLNTRIRLSEDDVKRLEYCHQKTGFTKSEIIRMGIQEVYNKLKK